MYSPIPVLICTVLADILGLAQLFCPWDPEAPVRAGKSTFRVFFVLIPYFVFLLAAIIVLCLPVYRLYFDLQLPLELSLLNGLSVEVFFLWRTFTRPRTVPLLRILIPTLAMIAGSLLIAGPSVSFYNHTIGRYVAFSGCLLFRASAAVVFIYHLKYDVARHRKLICVSVIYGFAVLGGSLCLLITDGYMFLLANCILGCVINFIILALAQMKWHKKDNRHSAASSPDEGNDEEDNLGNDPSKIRAHCFCS
ncbi:hypothetical protein K505DRAFT_88230 [Melanomma pulvis-pyrius CBS 109.77]|uniref:Uncharacterized protein n=1 Tax=Melanomma pulvis-pyrius CBS 109.77 TaxID=1314802 RepID=A0A6A6X0J2_9PLEO|nr:hypothetical protein K505DRAFT_88230 [Melanomma pulvis-pyrius CBS 109.77]